jgi:hypothetical protein
VFLGPEHPGDQLVGHRAGRAPLASFQGWVQMRKLWPKASFSADTTHHSHVPAANPLADAAAAAAKELYDVNLPAGNRTRLVRPQTSGGNGSYSILRDRPI